jgi:hypothetical protein
MEARDDSGSSTLEMTEPADLKSAGHSAAQVLYKPSPECSKTPRNALLQSLLHNNIRKTGSIRNPAGQRFRSNRRSILFSSLQSSSPLPTVPLIFSSNFFTAPTATADAVLM